MGRHCPATVLLLHVKGPFYKIFLTKNVTVCHVQKSNGIELDLSDFIVRCGFFSVLSPICFSPSFFMCYLAYLLRFLRVIILSSYVPFHFDPQTLCLTTAHISRLSYNRPSIFLPALSSICLIFLPSHLACHSSLTNPALHSSLPCDLRPIFHYHFLCFLFTSPPNSLPFVTFSFYMSSFL